MKNMHHHRKACTFGFLFGLVAPAIGLFFGLQVSPTVGNILMFPFLFVSTIVDKPIGMFSQNMMIFSWALSAVVWCWIFFLLASVFGKKQKGKKKKKK